MSSNTRSTRNEDRSRSVTKSALSISDFSLLQLSERAVPLLELAQRDPYPWRPAGQALGLVAPLGQPPPADWELSDGRSTQSLKRGRQFAVQRVGRERQTKTLSLLRLQPPRGRCDQRAWRGWRWRTAPGCHYAVRS